MDSSDVFPWSSDFETGLPEIDAQHKGLVDLLNLLVKELAAQRRPVQLKDIFLQLKKYAVIHFSDEEDVWHQAFGCAYWGTNHSKAHNHFVKEVLRLESKGETFDSVLREIIDFMAQWLVRHILESDMRMAKTVLALKTGVDLQKAKEIANKQLSGETRVKIETMVSKYDRLTSKAEQL
jgi:hemerythrin-like metal-binding protein